MSTKPVVLDTPLVTADLPRESVTVAHCNADGSIIRRMTMYAIPGHTRRMSLIRGAHDLWYGRDRDVSMIGTYWIADGVWDAVTDLRVSR